MVVAALTEAPRPPSQSAMLTAAARAMLREGPQPWIFDDPLAAGLGGETGKDMIERARRIMSAEELLSFCRWVGARARVAEDVVYTAIGEGVGQYVILGAGLDSFAYRHPDLQARLRVFEVDHPASQTWKRQRLQELGVAPPPNLVYAPVDFERQTLDDGLRAAGFDYAVSAVFSWMGVTMYLTVEAIRATLRSVAATATGSRVVLTYNLPSSALDDYSRRVTAALQKVVTETGEPFVSLFTTAEIGRLVADEGFSEIQDFGPDDAIRQFFANRDDVRLAGAQRILLAAVQS